MSIHLGVKLPICTNQEPSSLSVRANGIMEKPCLLSSTPCRSSPLSSRSYLKTGLSLLQWDNSPVLYGNPPNLATLPSEFKNLSSQPYYLVTASFLTLLCLSFLCKMGYLQFRIVEGIKEFFPRKAIRLLLDKSYILWFATTPAETDSLELYILFRIFLSLKPTERSWMAPEAPSSHLKYLRAWMEVK